MKNKPFLLLKTKDRKIHRMVIKLYFIFLFKSDTIIFITAGGYYHGSLIFTKDFPFKPPSIYSIMNFNLQYVTFSNLCIKILVYTPNGRFKPNKRLCLSISDYHPDTWNPAWSASTILTGLLSIMLENTPLLGSCESTTNEKRRLAMNSLEFNLKNEIFNELFPDLVTEIKEKLEKINEIKRQNEKEAKDKMTSESNQLDSTSNNGVAYNFCFNVIIIVLFGVFVCIVKKIYESGDSDE